MALAYNVRAKREVGRPMAREAPWPLGTDGSVTFR